MPNIVTDLEHSVLERYCSSVGIVCPPKSLLFVSDRDRNPVGFMTEILETTDALKISGGAGISEFAPYARTLHGDEGMGFVLYFRNGHIQAIEGYAEGNGWPVPEWPVVFVR